MKKQQLKMQRNYKDTVFRMLFNNKEALLSLYNAINGTHYDRTDDLEIITLENAVYMAMKLIRRHHPHRRRTGATDETARRCRP